MTEIDECLPRFNETISSTFEKKAQEPRLKTLKNRKDLDSLSQKSKKSCLMSRRSVSNAKKSKHQSSIKTKEILAKINEYNLAKEVAK